MCGYYLSYTELLNLHHVATTCNLMKPRAYPGVSRTWGGCKGHSLGSWVSALVAWTRSLCETPADSISTRVLGLKWETQAEAKMEGLTLKKHHFILHYTQYCIWFFVRIKARFNSINMVDANQSVHLYYFGLFYTRLVEKRQLCLSYDIKGRLWSQRSSASVDRHWPVIRRGVWDLSCPFTLHGEHVLILFYRELITRPGKFIPEYETDVRRWCQSAFK